MNLVLRTYLGKVKFFKRYSLKIWSTSPSFHHSSIHAIISKRPLTYSLASHLILPHWQVWMNWWKYMTDRYAQVSYRFVSCRAISANFHTIMHVLHILHLNNTSTSKLVKSKLSTNLLSTTCSMEWKSLLQLMEIFDVQYCNEEKPSGKGMKETKTRFK